MMGIDLTKQLIVCHAANLTASEIIVAGYMCLTALDKPNTKGQPAGLYFAGWEPLALALGYDELTNAAKTKVKRAVRGCRDKGVIKPLVNHAQTGERQVYRIAFAPTTGGRDQTPNRGSGSDPQEGVGSGPDWGSESDPPRTQPGVSEDLTQDSTLIAGPEVQAAGGSKSSGHKFVGEIGGDCGVCGKGYQNRTAHPLRLAWGA